VITGGSPERPVQLDHYQLIVGVGWGAGGFGVLEITAPTQMGFYFGQFDVTGTIPPPPPGGSKTFTQADIHDAITEILFDNPVLGNLYTSSSYSWIIEAGTFPDTPPPFDYETMKSLYEFTPGHRWVEVVDLRTLGHDEFPAFYIHGWPTDGNWADPDFPWGYNLDGRPGYLPPSSGSDPSEEGYTIEPFWGLGERQETSAAVRDYRKYAYLLDFRSIEGRIGEGMVELSINNPTHDDRLPSYIMQMPLRMYGEGAVFKVAGTSITATAPPPPPNVPLPPSLSQTKTAAYDQPGVIARITRAGYQT
jgi:hypothetical protein